MDDFWNRREDLTLIEKNLGRATFGYITGRRRIGKTALLRQACENMGGLYYQAIEGTPAQQLFDLTEELKYHFKIFGDVTPKNWTEFFRLLSQESLPPLLVFDEFPYWVEADLSFPSLLQKWLDHELPRHKTLLLVSGSSQSMLYSNLLNRSAPLYGRAGLHLHLAPLTYDWFCRALGYSRSDPRSFERYCLVGGVPHYWKLLPKGTLIHQATSLYFELSAILAEEPKRLLQDEKIAGAVPKAILDLIGRGVTKPSELASRLGDKQSNLSRPLALLLDLGLIVRELPFGESTRTTKRVYYQIQDAPLSFYYGVFLPMRSRWPILTDNERRNAMAQHFARQWEIHCRSLHPGSGRYWEGDVEIDLVAPQKQKDHYLVAECKWSSLNKKKEAQLLEGLKKRFSQTKLNQKLRHVEFQIFSQDSLKSMHP